MVWTARREARKEIKQQNNSKNGNELHGPNENVTMKEH